MNATILDNLEADIPRNVAQSAHYGTSFVPERRAEQEQQGYAETLRGDYENLSKLATTDEKRATLDEQFARYREAYKRHSLTYLHSRSRLVSPMIAGPSRFPTRQMEKRGNWTHNHLTRLIKFRERALAAIRKALTPELRPIMAGDSDATERLQAKIADAERLQEIMRASNAAIRKHKKAGPDAQVTALVALGHPEGRARRLLEPDCCGRIGFPDYALSNNNANIKRMKGRLSQVSRNQTAETTEHEGANARLEDCPAENRVRLFFPGKPSDDIRAKLKSKGFRWTPSLGCWQAYRNHWSIELAKEIAS